MKNTMTKYFESCFDFFENKDQEMISHCILCGHKRYYQYLKHPKMQIVRCEKCGFVWNMFQPTEKILEQFYKESNAMTSWSKIKQTTKEMLRQRDKYAGIYDYIQRNDISSILDVGCGNGYFLNHSGCQDIIGIESNIEATKNCKFVVYEAFKDFVKSKDSQRKFSLITMFGVLEHVKDPKGFIKAYKPFVKSKGSLAVIVPNVFSTVVQQLKEKCSTFCPQHLWYYDINTLELLMKDCGLKLVEWHTVEPEIQPIYRLLSGHEPYDKIKIDYKNKLFNEKNILKNNLGYKIVAFFKMK
jgi:cyclopropane fatty-acyl-phospholipid synthase-like methyltransferase